MVMPTAEERKKILDVLVKNGLFALLFTALLGYVLVTNNDRERRYLSTIDTLAKRLTVMDVMQRDIVDIKDILVRGR
jgi:hypothetical protein